MSGSANGHMECVIITILEDFAIEEIESFLLVMTTLDPDVILTANSTLITIMDNDGLFILYSTNNLLNNAC